MTPLQSKEPPQFLRRAEAKDEQSKSKSEQASCTLSGGTEVAASAMSPMPGAVGSVGSSPASSTLGGGVEQAPSAGASVPMVPQPIHEHGSDDDDESMPLVCDVDTCDGEEALPLPGKKRQRQPTPLEAKLRSPPSGDADELLPDLDDALTCRRTCPRVSAILGPQTLAESFDFPSQYIETMRLLSVPKGHDFIQTMVANVRAGVVITEVYAGSGVGGSVARQVWERILVEFNSQGLEHQLVIYAVWDTNNTCQQVLANHEPGSRALHRFGDIKDRLPSDARQQLVNIEKDFLGLQYRQLKVAVKGDQDNPPTITADEFEQKKADLGMEYVRALTEILKVTTFEEKAWCLQCEQYCCISPRSDERFRNYRWSEFGGNTCCPISAMNQARTGLLDAATLSVLTWGYSAAFYEPDDVVNECVPSQQEEPFLEMLNGPAQTSALAPQPRRPKHEHVRPLPPGAPLETPRYNPFSLRWSPADGGVPASRRRFWAWYRLTPIIKQLIGMQNMLKLFRELFFRRLAADASIYMVVPAALQLVHKRGWAAQRGEGWRVVPDDDGGSDAEVPATQERAEVVADAPLSAGEQAQPQAADTKIKGASGERAKDTELKALSTLGPFAQSVYRVRLQRYHEMREASFRRLGRVHIVNLEQTADFFYGESPLAPALLRRSMLFDLVQAVELIPAQHLLIQGFPAPPFAPPELAKFFPFPKIFTAGFVDADASMLNAADVRTLTGNSFHWLQAGAMLMFMWSTSVLADVT